MEIKRWMKQGAGSLLLTMTVILCTILLYAILERRHWRWDFTAHQEFSLSEQTRKVLAGLDRKVRVVAFFRRQGDSLDDVFIRRKVDDVLREYAARSSKIEYQMVDPDVQVELAVQDAITTDGTIVFQSEKSRKEIYQSQLFDYSQMEEKALPLFAGEGLFTNALLKVTKEKQEKVCLLEGHGERPANDRSPAGFSQLQEYLTKNNEQVQVFNLLTEEALPCDLLVIGGPSRSLADPEDTKIRDWFEKNGHLLLMLEPNGRSESPLPKTLKLLAVDPQNDVVFDPERHFVLGPHFPSPLLKPHKITDPLVGVSPVFSTARSLSFKEEAEKFTTQELLTTSPKAWGETDLSGVEAQFNEKKDFKGPLTLAVTVERDHHPAAVIVGDADFASNGLIQAPGNLDLFLNMVGWLLGDEGQISIRPKTPEFRNLSMTPGKARFIAIFSQFVYPLAVFLAGGLYWFRRRRA